MVGTLGTSYLLTLVLGLNLGLPVGMPPLPADPVMARIAPDNCVYYLACSGTATPDPNSANQTEQLLAEEEVQDFLKQLEEQVTNAVQREAQKNPQHAAALRELPAIAKTLLLRPAVIFLSKLELNPDGPPAVEGALVIDAGEKATALKESLLKLEAAAISAATNNGAPQVKSQEVVVAGVAFRRLPVPPPVPEILWAVEKGRLIVTIGEGTAKGLIARMADTDRKSPDWLTEVNRKMPVERLSLVSYLNVATALDIAKPFVKEPQLLKMLDVSGVASVRSISSVAGLQGEGVLSQGWIDCGGKPAGIFGLISDKPLSAADLKAIPSDATTAVALRLALADVYTYVFDAMGQIDPKAQGGMTRELGQIEAQLGIKLQDDLLKPLGDVIAIFNAPAEGGSLLTGVALTISLRDRERLAKTEDHLLKLAETALAIGGAPNKPSIKRIAYKGHEIRVVTLGPGMPITPAWCLSDGQLIVGLSPQIVKAILHPAPQSKSLAEVDSVAALLGRPRGPSAISFQDTEQLVNLGYSYAQIGLPMLNQQLSQQGTGFEIPELPALTTIKAHLRPNVAAFSQIKDGWLTERTQTLPMVGDATAIAPVAVGLLLPAVQNAQGAARRAQSMNNLKQLALAMFVHENQEHEFMAAAICDEQGKPLLSWRVKVLPYIEQTELYSQFHLNEPWDSEHNLKLVARMPQIYQAPSAEPTAAGKTVYLAIVGEHAVFDKRKGRKIATITDGTSNTIMLVEARPDHAVVWTKPEDLPLDEQLPAALRSARTGGFVAAFADGSVRLIADSVGDKMLKLLFTVDDGQVVPQDF